MSDKLEIWVACCIYEYVEVASYASWDRDYLLKYVLRHWASDSFENRANEDDIQRFEECMAEGHYDAAWNIWSDYVGAYGDVHEYIDIQRVEIMGFPSGKGDNWWRLWMVD